MSADHTLLRGLEFVNSMLDANFIKNFKFIPILNFFRGKPKRIGINNEGNDANLHDNEFENLDEAIKNKGDNLEAERNKIK